MPSDDSRQTFADGVREGRLLSIEQQQAAHGLRLDRVEGRVSALERVAYTLIGAVALIQFAPSLQGFMG